MNEHIQCVYYTYVKKSLQYAWGLKGMRIIDVVKI